jgi:hypothetical protein
MIRIQIFLIINPNLGFLNPKIRNPKSGFGRFSKNPDFICITSKCTSKYTQVCSNEMFITIPHFTNVHNISLILIKLKKSKSKEANLIIKTLKVIKK